MNEEEFRHRLEERKKKMESMFWLFSIKNVQEFFCNVLLTKRTLRISFNPSYDQAVVVRYK